MCTVTYVPIGDGVIVTSNRDEQPGRSAQAPAWHIYNNKKIAFPKEPRAGGSWFVADGAGNLAVLMNGGFEKHEWKPPYRKSRGLVLLDFFSDDDPAKHWQNTCLDGIEPFTIVWFWQKNLYRLVWDGEEKHFEPLNPADAYIWSSAPLYGAGQRMNRAKLFADFTAESPPAPDDLMRFHTRTGDEQDEGFVIERGFLRTVSITQAVIGPSEILVTHHDLVGGASYQFKAR